MKRHASLAALTTAAVLIASAPASAMLPVVDVGAITQLLTQIRTAQQQLSAVKDQLSEARRSYQAITGARGMERVLTGANRNYLPQNWAQLSAAVSSAGGTYGALTADVQRALKANAVLPAATLSALAAEERRAIEDTRRSTALLQALSREALSNTSARFAQLQRLIDAIPKARDPKAIAELQARIDAEQTMIANEATKLQTLYQAAQAEEAAAHLRIKEIAIASFGSMRTLPPMGLR